jgi:D-serine deaminase-like pyridoxal phosphate-dependent protein
MTRPRTIAEIPTPALLVDVAAMERNIRRMAEFFAEEPCRLRPHFKAHKTPEIARRQLAAGSCSGLTCATVSEAEAVADFCDDVLIANQVIGSGKPERVAALARRIDIKVAVDSDAGVDELSAAASAAGVQIGALVEVSSGFRCGVAPGEEAVRLARRVHEAPGLRLRGLMGYEGHAVGIEERASRETTARAAMERLLSSVRLVREAGLPCEIVSAGGTGTYDITGRLEGITEIQAGCYALMDRAYAKLDLPFEKALSLLGTVLSRPSASLCVADCGHKSCTYDHGNPSVIGIEGASVAFLSDEHASITIPPHAAIAPGDRVLLRPGHVDPTINLHDVLYALDGEQVVGVWPVAARGYAEQREAIA